MPLKYALSFIALIVIIIISVNLKNKSERGLEENQERQVIPNKEQIYNTLPFKKIVLDVDRTKYVICGNVRKGEKSWPNSKACLKLSRNLELLKNNSNKKKDHIVIYVDEKQLVLSTSSQSWVELKEILGKKQVDQAFSGK